MHVSLGHTLVEGWSRSGDLSQNLQVSSHTARAGKEERGQREGTLGSSEQENSDRANGRTRPVGAGVATVVCRQAEVSSRGAQDSTEATREAEATG